MSTRLHTDTADLSRIRRQDPPEPARPAEPRGSAPRHTAPGLLAFIWRESALAQVGLALLAVAVFLAGLAPIELQRRAVGLAVRGADPHPLLGLALLYVLTAASLGGLKLALNLGRGFVGERAVRRLRAAIMADVHAASGPDRGVEIAMVLDEAEPVGSFVGICLSEPLLQAGVLVSTLTYLALLHPLMALVTLAVFSPQIVFVPLMQRAINRRVAARVGLLRRISGGLVERPAALPGPTPAELDRLDGVFRLNMGIFGFKFSMNFLMNLSYHLGIAGILAVGGYAVAAGEAELGTVVAFVSGLAHMNDPWGDLVSWFRDVSVTRTKYGLIARATGGAPALAG
ncbi:ABC transporter ATP-binding protein [Methylobacterium currus]|uniref:ABC transporter ATP-binding protein n=1 Tax=Methylobacterium currus TaxID=2051553 RepID=A0A2R4WWE9_9HYPH|nr:ABC transporter ATP-binding protein [Methylobacterium currus]AWB25878.1 ABC transporter ATP-binding protein [Methylobacterium currus]